MIKRGMFLFIFILFGFSSISALNCPHPDADVNTKVTTTGLEPGKLATYTCDTDYELFGDTTRTCGADGSWTGQIPMCATNVAWRKPVNQSSTVRGGPPENANDGDSSTVHDGSKCTETTVEDSPWWSVDLLQSYEISHVRITTRGCCDQEDIQDLEVRVGYSAELQQRNRLCTWHPGIIEKGTTKELKCARPMEGRYVFIQMVGVVGSLSLCEVEVFSKQELSKDRCRGDFDVNKLGLFNRTCYEFQITSGGSFKIARNYCQKRKQGDLVHGIEPMAQKFLVSELKRLEPEMQTKMLWIGVQKEPQFISRTWRWVDGTKVQTPAWGREQPNNYNGEQNCVVLDGGREWLWNDVGCNLNYLVWMCQFQPSCGSPDLNLNTTVSIKDMNNGTVASYECPEGSKLEGKKDRDCSPSGYWFGEAPSCTYIECGTPPSTEHGVVSLIDSRSNYGARASYVCAENYTLDGNQTVTCGDVGTWQPVIPKCLYSWCSDLETPENGKLILSGRRSGDTATYECNPGYYLVGQETLSCSLGGTWSGTPPNCRFIDCGLPETIDHGKMTLVNSTTYVGSLAVYECDEDYWLGGLNVRSCENSGFWKGEKPTCKLIDCGEPDIPLGGYVTGYSFEVHSVVEYHCDMGHYMTGKSTTTCTRDGKWSGEAPTCSFVDCGRLQPIVKGEIVFADSEAPTYLGSKVNYNCTPNYRLVGGDQMRICAKNGEWTGDNPRCEEIRCPEPKHPEKSRYSVTGNDRRISLALTRARHHKSPNSSYKVGSQISYRCNRGHVVEGLSTRTCHKNGTWSGVSPKCKHIDCGIPPSVDNGIFRLLSNETSFGSVVAYECNPNWKINGKVRRFCQENGTWSGPYPKCGEVLCLSLTENLEKKYKEQDGRAIEPWNKDLLEQKEKEKLIRIMVDDGNRNVGSNARYKCREGQKVVGEETRLCKQHGVWGGAQPNCEWIYCTKPNDIPNGRVHLTKDELKFGSVVEYFCLPKYHMRGPFNRTCTANGTWSSVVPICTLDDTDIGIFDGNSLDGSSNLARGPLDEIIDGPSYTGIYVGIGVSFLLVVGVVVTLLFFKMRERKLGKVSSSSNSSNSSTKPVESSYPSAMTYGDLNDPTTGNNIYEHIPDDIEPSYTNMSPTNNTFTPAPQGTYSNYPAQHTYSNARSELRYSNSNASSAGYAPNGGRVPSHIARRPKMPPPQPPQLPRSPSTAGVTVNGVTVNTS